VNTRTSTTPTEPPAHYSETEQPPRLWGLFLFLLRPIPTCSASSHHPINIDTPRTPVCTAVMPAAMSAPPSVRVRSAAADAGRASAATTIVTPTTCTDAAVPSDNVSTFPNSRLCTATP
jgi:hypothetical protein